MRRRGGGGANTSYYRARRGGRMSRMICRKRMFGNNIISSSDMCHGCALEVVCTVGDLKYPL
jgi:hypothetical protein